MGVYSPLTCHYLRDIDRFVRLIHAALVPDGKTWPVIHYSIE
ncbi:hypothetical protein [Pseudochrobactrum sp. Wa41.01b-1]|nr:hypothetical protein [Pseudochrobactrum sp. Wa41.01b-1]